MDKEYHYFYKITNKVNGKFYYGVHSTNNLNDGYMGSGNGIRNAIRKYGVENFIKEYVRFFESRDDMFKYEQEVVTKDIVSDPNCYNSTTGGKGGGKEGIVVTKDKSGNIYVVSTDDPRYLSGELKHNTCGFAVVRDENGRVFQISINDPDYHKYEPINKGKAIVIGPEGKPMRISIDDPDYHKYKHINKGKVMAKDLNGNTIRTSTDDPRLQSGELVGITKGQLTVKDKDGNKIVVSKNDPRFKTGELTGYRKNMVTVKDKDGNKFSVYKDDPRYINKEVLPLYVGMTWIKKDGVCKHVQQDELQQYLDDGWAKGRILKKKIC